jgi:GTPase SAR1 family protein
MVLHDLKGRKLMALLAKKPKKIDKRLKLMMFGPPGVGKTTAAIQFPKPYILDTERGAENDQYVDAINKSDGAILSTTSFDTIVDQVRALASEPRVPHLGH